MFSITGRKRVPIIPGDERILPERCAACGNGVRIKVREVHGKQDITLCLDWRACIAAWRERQSAKNYAADLACETLTREGAR